MDPDRIRELVEEYVHPLSRASMTHLLRSRRHVRDIEARELKI